MRTSDSPAAAQDLRSVLSFLLNSLMDNLDLSAPFFDISAPLPLGGTLHI